MRKHGVSITQLEREAILKFVDGNFTYTHECLSGMLKQGLSRANVMESLANGDIAEYVLDGNKNRILVKSRMKFHGRSVLVTLQLKSREIIVTQFEDSYAPPIDSGSKIDILKNLKKYA